MQLAQQYAPLTSLASLNDVHQLVIQHLRRDWVIRIEHADQTSLESNDWNQWDKAMYALQTAEPVIDAILSCQVSYPAHAIRLYAEKMRPQTRMIYWIQPPRREAQQQYTWKTAGISTSTIPNKPWQVLTNKNQTTHDVK